MPRIGKSIRQVNAQLPKHWGEGLNWRMAANISEVPFMGDKIYK